MSLSLETLLLTDSTQKSYDADILSPNDMLVDPDEYVVEPPENEKDDVAIINPDQLGSDVELPDLPRADDCKTSHDQACSNCADIGTDEAMKEVVLPPLPEFPPILEDQVHTWNIEGWKSMARKEHGPVLEAGDSPW